MNINNYYNIAFGSNRLKRVALSAPYNVSTYEGYENFTVDNFAIEITGWYAYIPNDVHSQQSGGKTESFSITKSYDPVSGIFTMSGSPGTSHWDAKAYASYVVYLIYVE